MAYDALFLFATLLRFCSSFSLVPWFGTVVVGTLSGICQSSLRVSTIRICFQGTFCCPTVSGHMPSTTVMCHCNQSALCSRCTADLNRVRGLGGVDIRHTVYRSPNDWSPSFKLCFASTVAYPTAVKESIRVLSKTWGPISTVLAFLESTGIGLSFLDDWSPPSTSYSATSIPPVGLPMPSPSPSIPSFLMSDLLPHRLQSALRLHQRATVVDGPGLLTVRPQTSPGNKSVAPLRQSTMFWRSR